jgi:hypothetical protein
MATTIKLPRLFTAFDYHEIISIADCLDGTGLRAREVGFDQDCGMYIGVVYTGRMPGKKMLEAMAKRQKLRLDD